MADRLKLEDLQSFEDLFAPKEQVRETQQEQRRADRKAVTLRGMITIDGIVTEINTVDLSAGGMSVRASRLLGGGKEALVGFTLPDGQAVSAKVRLVYCFYTHENDFRAGMEFLAITAGADVLKRFLET